MSDLEIIRGDTPTVRVGPVKREGALVDLTGATAKLSVRASVESTLLFFSNTPVINLAEATIDFVLDGTAAFPLGACVYDAEVTELDGTVTTFPRSQPGRAHVIPDVTHA